MKTITKNYVKQFGELFIKGNQILGEACEVYARAVAENPMCKKEFMDEYPDIPSTMWNTFEKIGNKQLDMRLMGGTVKNSSYIRKLPYSDQKRIMDGDLIEMYTSGGDSINVDVKTCSKGQAELIFDGDRIRTPSEQRAYMEDVERVEELIERTETVKQRYKVKGAKVLVLGGCELTKSDLLNMLAEMK